MNTKSKLAVLKGEEGKSTENKEFNTCLSVINRMSG